MTGDACIENAVFDVSAHFLRPKHDGLNLFVIYTGQVTSFGIQNMKSGFIEKIDCGFLETTCRDADF
jgi:hypothetical protein